MTTPSLLQASGLRKTFGDNVVLDGVDLDVPEGTTTAIIGPSGSGKTTLLRSLNALTVPDAGTVSIGDVSVDFGSLPRGKEGRRACERLRAQSGMVFQSHELFPHRTVLGNLVEGPVQVQGEDPDEAAARARALLEQVGLAGREDAYPSQLSGGQQQRVAIARALMQDPKVILADEPIASLDPMNAQIVMDALRRIHDEDGRMVIANLHTLDTARRYCDRVIGMRDGRIVFDGTPEQLTTGVARDIYGADETFSEEATSTEIRDHRAAPVRAATPA